MSSREDILARVRAGLASVARETFAVEPAQREIPRRAAPEISALVARFVNNARHMSSTVWAVASWAAVPSPVSITDSGVAAGKT